MWQPSKLRAEGKKKAMASAVDQGEALTLGLTKANAVESAGVEFKHFDTSLAEWNGDLLAVGIFQDKPLKAEDFKNNELMSTLDASVDGALQELTVEYNFEGKLGETSVVRLTGKKIKRLALVGLGKFKTPSTGAAGVWKAFGEKVAVIAKPSKVASLGIILAGPIALGDEAVEAIVTGVILGNYEDTRFKSEAKPSSLRQVYIGTDEDHMDVIERAQSITSGVILARQLVAAPANVLTPEALADAVNEIALAYSDVFTVRILERADCEKLGMGSYLGVANASDLPPKFIHLKYTPTDGKVEKRLAVIGKGITHDTGGYNLKSGAGCKIEFMKDDMGGAGATFGAAAAIGELIPKGVEVHFISAVCENMISGKGMHPGDIITASNGKTIEVNNTDAEGRLTLADALVYACRLKVDAVVDLATLTGAIVVALGDGVAGFFSTNDGLATDLSTAATAAGEKLWRMPLVDEYMDALKSPIADYVNTGGRPGGAIKAALFLREFVDESVPWAHIDIAGTAFDDKKGTASGFGVQTLVNWICSYETHS